MLFPNRRTHAIEARQLAHEFARILTEFHCRNVQILDVTGVSPLCNYLLIATGTSRTQMKAVLYKLEDFAKQHGHAPLLMPDPNSEHWMLADYVDVVVHIFSADRRHYYDLEMLWGDVPKIVTSDE